MTGLVDGGRMLYHVQADEGDGSRILEGQTAVDRVARRPKPSARELANRIQAAYRIETKETNR